MTKNPEDVIVKKYPILTVDALVKNMQGELLLIKRKNPPYGWALPGGLVDYGEDVITAVRRELKEETGLIAVDVSLFCVASDPNRDPRFHAVSLVYQIDSYLGTPQAADDAEMFGWFSQKHIFPASFCEINVSSHAYAHAWKVANNAGQLGDIVFDHKKIIEQFYKKEPILTSTATPNEKPFEVRIPSCWPVKPVIIHL